jgi:hypothetical protein
MEAAGGLTIPAEGVGGSWIVKLPSMKFEGVSENEFAIMTLARMIGKAEIMDSPDPGGLGGTYGGSPIGCAAAHAVLDVIEEENLCERSSRLGART